MEIVKERKTKLQKDNARLRFSFSLWRKQRFNPPFTEIERRAGLPAYTLSHWIKGRDINSERLDKIRQIIG